MEQCQLEQTFLASLMVSGLSRFKELPEHFRPTVFSIGAYQNIYRAIEKLGKAGEEFDPIKIMENLDGPLPGEVAMIVGNVAVDHYFGDLTFEEAALELIRRAEIPSRRTAGDGTSGTTEETSRSIDTSQFKPMSSQELISVLGLTIKSDEQNKLITFFAELSAYTEDSQLNISFNAPSSTGKSYIPTEIARLFPPQDVIEVGYCSPTAFFHDVGQFDKEKAGYIIDLSRKILIFLDQPHTQLLQHLRPILSHDKKEIQLKITDKSQKGGLKTKNIFLKGFPAVIFCTAGLEVDEQEATRFILLSPQTNQGKIRAAIHELYVFKVKWTDFQFC